MSESTSSGTELTSQYVAQVANDLEANVKEQERISAEISALQEQLVTLQHDHTVLVNMQQALGIAASAPQPAPLAEPETAAVPSPRRKKAAAEPGGKGARAKKSTATAPERAAASKRAPKEPVAKKPAAKKPAPTKSAATKPTVKKSAAKTAAAKPAQPTLVELVRTHLGEQKEPRSAAEVATALGQIHPDRGIKVTVVRTTLEGLVARNQAQRSKQGTSVFYTAPDAAQTSAQPQGEEQTEQGDS